MKESSLKLQDKTALMIGPFNGITQGILRTLTEFGADIAFVSQNAKHAQRYSDGVNEAREIHPHYGRAAHFDLPYEKPEEIKEALSRVAQTFGRIDILIDASPLSWTGEQNAEEKMALARVLFTAAMPFFVAKQRGRVVYLFEDACLEKLPKPVLPKSHRDKLESTIFSFASEARANHVTVNGLALGVGEDYLLQHYASVGSIKKSLEQLQGEFPRLRLVESTEVALGVAYLSSALCASLTGQILRLTHGFHLEA